MNWDVNWDAFSAVGQWAAAIATLLAVLFALRQSRPRVVLSVMDEVCPTSPLLFSDDNVRSVAIRVVIRVTNIGAVPVSIQTIGFQGPRGYKLAIVGAGAGSAKALMPGEITEVSTAKDDLERQGWSRLDVAWAEDTMGRTYHMQVPVCQRISRWYWWRFGRLNST